MRRRCDVSCSASFSCWGRATAPGVLDACAAARTACNLVNQSDNEVTFTRFIYVADCKAVGVRAATKPYEALPYHRETGVFPHPRCAAAVGAGVSRIEDEMRSRRERCALALARATAAH